LCAKRFRLNGESYRLLVPRVSAFGFFLLEPRGVVRAAFAGAALRAARFTFLRSTVSVMLLVFAILLFS